MSTATLARPVGDSLGLTYRPLPRWAPWAVAAVAAVVAGALLVVLGSTNPGLWLLLFDLLFIVGIGAASGRVEGKRRATDRVVTAVVYTCFALAIIPLAGLLITVVRKGSDKFSVDFLTHSMRGVRPRDDAGGAYHAIIGTLEQVSIATVIAVPIGLLVAVYLVEYGRGRLAKVVTFFVDVMTGVPSIVAGLFIYSLFILQFGFQAAGWLGSLALTILMMPVVVRSVEEMLKLVPNELREASLALGVPRWKTILSIVIPTAIAGIITGIMLSIARVIGETAPLLLTTFFTDSINLNPFKNAQIALPQYVYQQASLPNVLARERAWAGALTLILIVMILNLTARALARWKAPKAR